MIGWRRATSGASHAEAITTTTSYDWAPRANHYSGDGDSPSGHRSVVDTVRHTRRLPEEEPVPPVGSLRHEPRLASTHPPASPESR